MIYQWVSLLSVGVVGFLVGAVVGAVVAIGPIAKALKKQSDELDAMLKTAAARLELEREKGKQEGMRRAVAIAQ